MNPRLYLTRKATLERQRCLAWIMAHRPRNSRLSYALALLKDTPAHVAQQWRNGNIPATITQTGIAASIGLAFGCMFGLAI